MATKAADSKANKVSTADDDDNAKDSSRSYQDKSHKQTNDAHKTQGATSSSHKGFNSQVKVETEQEKVVSPEKEQLNDDPSDDESEPETDECSLTEDQRRAMMELSAQKQEDTDSIGDELPEYNVKGRLVQLNEDLANDPTPVQVDREQKVGFKAKIVDLVASPPPDLSDDELSSSSIKQDQQPVTSTPVVVHKENKSCSDSKDEDKSAEYSDDPNKKQFVVEQEGQFYVVSANELATLENGKFVDFYDSNKKVKKQSENQSTYRNFQSGESFGEGDYTNSSSDTVSKSPRSLRPRSVPPGPKKNAHLFHPLRPQTADQLNNSENCCDNFNYNSPYAMTAKQKEEAKQQARRNEVERKEREERKRLEEEERRRNNEHAFQSWLCRKRQDDKKRDEQGEQEKQLLEMKKKIVNEEAFKVWLRGKKIQNRQEKLLKRQQQRELNEGLILHSTEDCDKAFKKWLKKKNSEEKKQHLMEKQNSRLYRIHVKKSRKMLALIKAVMQCQGLHYVDYYGYKF